MEKSTLWGKMFMHISPVNCSLFTLYRSKIGVKGVGTKGGDKDHDWENAPHTPLLGGTTAITVQYLYTTLTTYLTLLRGVIVGIFEEYFPVSCCKCMPVLILWQGLYLPTVAYITFPVH